MTQFWIAALLALTAAVPEPGGDDRPACLAAGIEEVSEGAFASGNGALDACIASLDATDSSDLADAYLYKGVAFVGLRQEEPAKAAFRKVLEYRPTFEPAANTFPPKIIRIFRAARVGKKKSVIDPPSGTIKKAGLGASGIAAIAGGVAIVGGGVAVIAAQPSATSPAATATSTATPTPTPTPTTIPAAPTCPPSETVFGDLTWRHPTEGEVVSGTITLQCAAPRQAVDFSYCNNNVPMRYLNDAGVIAEAYPPNFKVEIDSSILVNGVPGIGLAGVYCIYPYSTLAAERVVVRNPTPTETPTPTATATETETPTATATPGLRSAQSDKGDAVPPPPAPAKTTITWTSALSSTGGKGQVWLNGSSVLIQSSSQETVSIAVDRTSNTIEGELIEGRSAGAVWTFQLRSGFKPGSLKPQAGNVAHLLPDTIVFMLGGKKGERVAFTFESGDSSR